MLETLYDNEHNLTGTTVKTKTLTGLDQQQHTF